MTRPAARGSATVVTFEGDRPRSRRDDVATEEPMEIRIQSGPHRKTVAVTMRTPGADFELAAGFLFSEGIISSREDVNAIAYCVDREIDEAQRLNIITVDLDTLPELPVLERHFMTSSACGVCGSATIQALADREVPALLQDLRITTEVLYSLPGSLQASQRIFTTTGGLHAAALFTTSGTLTVGREDVGRHNATDKVIGWALLEDLLPASEAILMVSGRIGYEIVQKAICAGIPVVAAISAPTSLAVDLARSFGVTLVGFLRDRRMNVYAGDRRITQRSRS